MHIGQWLNSIIAGSKGGPFMPSCLLSPTFGSHAVSSMRWGNVPMVASATSCTCDPSPGISGGSSMGRDPGTGTSGPDCPKSGIERVSPVGKRSPTRSHTHHRPQERNRRRSPDHRHGCF